MPNFDIILACLPGHNGAPSFGMVTVDILAAGYAEALSSSLGQRKLLFVGESLGGLVGVAMAQAPPASVAAIVSLDPFLDGDVWPLKWMLENGHGTSVNSTFSGTYHHLLNDLRSPVHVIAGESLLGERRDGALPSLLLPQDRILVAKHCRLSVIPGGHHLVQDNPAACANIILSEARAIWSK